MNLKLSTPLSVMGLMALLCLLQACGDAETAPNKKLPFYGNHEINEGDTTFYKIPAFEFVDQDSSTITAQSFEGKIYVSDFFFTSCPTICPRMKAQMLRIQEAYKDEDRLVLLSHSIDPEYDNVSVLKTYADRLEIDSQKWHLVTGEKKEIYEIAEAYMVSAAEDENAPGGYLHSGAFVLVDTQGHIRGYYDGTKPETVDELIVDISLLLNE